MVVGKAVVVIGFRAAQGSVVDAAALLLEDDGVGFAELDENVDADPEGMREASASPPSGGMFARRLFICFASTLCANISRVQTDLCSLVSRLRALGAAGSQPEACRVPCLG